VAPQKTAHFHICQKLQNSAEISHSYINLTSSKWKCAVSLGHPVYAVANLRDDDDNDDNDDETGAREDAEDVKSI